MHIDSTTTVPGQGAGGGVSNHGGGPPAQPDPLNGNLAGENARIAFDAYYDEQASRFGLSRPAKQYEQNRNWPYFLQLSLVCSARGWDVADYVRSAVGGRRTTGCVMPEDLLRPGILEKYNPGLYATRDVKDEYRECVELLIAREYDSNGGNDEKSLLLSPMSAFPAWFRVWYPEQIDTDIVEMWGEIAKREISSSKGLVELLSGIDSAKWEKLKRLLWIYAPVEGDVK